MMNCNEVKESLSAFLDQELSNENSSQISAHLSGCDDCRLEYDSLKKVDGVLESMFTDFGKDMEEDPNFSRDVMAMVRVAKEPQVDLVYARLYRGAMFLVVWVAYLGYLFSQYDFHSIAAEKLSMIRQVIFFNIAIASMGLGFIFFAEELNKFNQKIMNRVSGRAKKTVLSPMDIRLGRLVGAVMVFAMLFIKIFN